MDDEIKSKINFEISQIDVLLNKSEVLLKKCMLDEPDFIELSAVGATLHSYYNGLENIFIMINKNIDHQSVENKRWHKELLDLMFVKTQNRNEVLNENLHEPLLDYMSFRHVFRHSYWHTLDWKRLKPLFLNLHENWANVKSCLAEFVGVI